MLNCRMGVNSLALHPQEFPCRCYSSESVERQLKLVLCDMSRLRRSHNSCKLSTSTLIGCPVSKIGTYHDYVGEVLYVTWTTPSSDDLATHTAMHGSLFLRDRGSCTDTAALSVCMLFEIDVLIVKDV